MPQASPAAAIDTAARAVLFDLDGVLTPTAGVHLQVWREVLSRVALEHGAAPCTSEDYFALIDGKPRLSGVAAFLENRSIVLPVGSSMEGPSTDSHHGIAALKNAGFVKHLVSEGVTPYPDAVEFLGRVTAGRLRRAVVSSSGNANLVLSAAGLRRRFEHVVDGQTAAANHLAGKPSPQTFWYGARLLQCDPATTVVVEDALSGVQAGRDGGFLLTIGVDRGAGRERLLAAGADVVVSDLREVEVLAR